MSEPKTTQVLSHTRIVTRAVVTQVRWKGGVGQVQFDLVGKLSGDQLKLLADLTKGGDELHPAEVSMILDLAIGPLFDGEPGGNVEPTHDDNLAQTVAGWDREDATKGGKGRTRKTKRGKKGRVK